MSSGYPDHWQLISGPTNWFQLRFPPEWSATVDESKITLAAPREEAVLHIACSWNEAAETLPLQDAIPVSQLFARTRAVREASRLTGEDESYSLMGEATDEGPVVWWQRPFQHGRWRRWRAWAVRRGPVLVVAHLLHANRPDFEMESMAAMILSTITFSETPADPPNVFAHRVLELARSKFPLLDCEAGEGFQLKLGDSSVNLFNFYRSYIKVPEKFEELMLPALTTVVQIQEWGSEQSRPPLDHVRMRIMPMLYPEDVWQQRFANFMGQPWIGGLAILYVVDESHAYWYIRQDLGADWGLSVDDLHTLALENLDTYFEHKPMELAVAGTETTATLVMPSHPDSYNAVRLLSEDFRGKMRELLGGTFAVGLPSRDFFVAVTLDSPEMVGHVGQRVKADYRESDHPLSEHLLLASPDGVSALDG